MIPPSDANKPRQLLRPKLPFQETSVQADPQSPMADSARQDVLRQQPPTTGSYPSQRVYGEPVSPPPAFNPEDIFEQPWSLATYGETQSNSPGQTPSAQQGIPPFTTGKQTASQFQPFATGKQTASQFQPFATGKQTASQFQPFATGKQAPSPVTGKQETTSFQPYGTGQQGVSQFQLPTPGVDPTSAHFPAFGNPGNGSFPAPVTDRQQIPPFPADNFGQQFNAPPSAFNAQNMFAAPSFPGTPPEQQYASAPWPATAPEQQYASAPWPAAAPEQQYASAPWPAAAPEQQYVSAPWPAAAPEQQYVSAPWPATSTGSRPVPAYARPSTKHASAPVELRKPLKMPKEPKAPKAPKQPGQKRKGPPILITAVCLVLVAAVVLISQKDWLFNQASQLTTGTQSITQTSSSSTPLAPGINTITNNKEISPFLFGTNMALFHDNDEPILNSAATRQQLKNIGVRIIRMPTRPTLKTQTEITAAEDIKAIGASALVVMAGPEYKSGPLLDTDQKIVSDITGVFGKQPVYFEFGNESDLNGINVNQYITKWNQVIPTLKKQFPTARFIALDNYQFDRLYLKTFLQQANPLPDGVSWHEYTCSVYWSAQFCLMNIDSWPIHFQQAREAMKEAIGKELPIWISEWNYTSDQVITNGKPIDDGKYNNPTFMNEWTTRAMQTLIQNRIFASMQYFATNQPMPLVYNNQIGIEGKIFQQNYKTVMVDDKTPPAQYYKVPPPVVDPNAQYSFEGPGTDGWSLVGGPPATISTTKALNGTHSLQFTLADNSENDFPFVSVGGSQMPSTPKAGQIISGYLYVANPKALINAKIFVADPSHAWHFTNSITLTPGAWNKVWYSLPLNYTSPVSQVGIQFFTSTPGVSTDVYLDQFAWK